MQKKVLAIVGSKRSMGNCELMAKEISRQIPEPHELSLLRLPDFDLRYCTGCYRCLTKERPCVLNDDLQTILRAIAAADGLIVAVPTYYLAAHSCLKVFLDRAISFYGMGGELWGKPAVGVAIAGIPGKEGSTLLDIERFFATLFTSRRQTAVMYGALPGEVLAEPENLRLAAELARGLFGDERRAQGAGCPCCGGKTFRFLEDGSVRCMLCSMAGSLEQGDDGWRIEVEADDHDFLGSEKAALQHRDWLLSMVGRYRGERERLKQLAAPYGADGTWIPTGRDAVQATERILKEQHRTSSREVKQ